jgi:uncharacterized RDD family membrane protein YckC/Tfp pilus assembly major pilin PilA
MGGAMEEDRTWSVTLTGKTLSGSDPQTVWQRTASMMKFEPDAFRERILERAPLTLKAVSPSDAYRQRDAMVDCGAEAIALDNPDGRYLWLQLNGKVRGPVSEAYVRQAIDEGALDHQVHACIKGEHAWQTLEAMFGLRPRSVYTDDIPAVAPFSAQRSSDAYAEMPEAVADPAAGRGIGMEPEFTPGFRIRLPENVPGVYGGFWMRVAALLIDIVIVWVLVFAMLMAFVFMHTPGSAETSRQLGEKLYPIVMVLLFGLPWLYFSLFESSAKQATPGKLALGLRVTDEKGGRIGLLRALGRNLGRYVSSAILYVGYMMAGWTSRKQTLHDLMASTFVVRKNGLQSWRQGDGVGVPAFMPAWAIALIVIVGGFFLMVPILAAIAIPAYQGYLVRAQATEAIVVTEPVRQAVAQYVLTHGSLPADNAEAGLNSTDPIHGHYVSSVEIANGTVVASFGSQATRVLQSGHITFTPTVSGQSIRWHCSGDGIAVSNLPLACRSP